MTNDLASPGGRESIVHVNHRSVYYSCIPYYSLLSLYLSYFTFSPTFLRLNFLSLFIFTTLVVLVFRIYIYIFVDFVKARSCVGWETLIRCYGYPLMWFGQVGGVLYHLVGRGLKKSCVLFYACLDLFLDVSLLKIDAISSRDVFNWYMGDRVGRGTVEVRTWWWDSHDIETESLSGRIDTTGVACCELALEMNHIRWYRLRTRVANVRCIFVVGSMCTEQYSTIRMVYWVPVLIWTCGLLRSKYSFGAGLILSERWSFHLGQRCEMLYASCVDVLVILRRWDY